MAYEVFLRYSLARAPLGHGEKLPQRANEHLDHWAKVELCCRQRVRRLLCGESESRASGHSVAGTVRACPDGG